MWGVGPWGSQGHSGKEDPLRAKEKLPEESLVPRV